MHELALFAGGAGGLLGTKWLLGWRTACYVEFNAYCVEVLKARIRDRLLDDAPIWDDVRTFDGAPWRGSVDIITAGFPCQPFSAAGKRRAGDDERNRWPDTIRIIREVEPEWVFLENVPALLWGSHGYFGQIQKDLAESGFNDRWDCIPASAVGANHQRDRLWVVAHAARNVFVGQGASDQDARLGPASSGQGQPGASAYTQQMAYPDKGGRGWDTRRQAGQESENGRWWAAEPGLGRVANGVADRVDRIRASGQGQVPAVVAAVWRLLAAR